MNDTVWWRLGDAFMPKVVRDKLYKPIYQMNFIEIIINRKQTTHLKR
jgi:hypothetical protein